MYEYTTLEMWTLDTDRFGSVAKVMKPATNSKHDYQFFNVTMLPPRVKRLFHIFLDKM